MKNNVFLIAGPGGTAFNKSDIKKLQSIISNKVNFAVVGDGERPISFEEINTKFNQFINDFSNHEKITVMLYMHGDNVDDYLRINLDGEGFNYDSRQLLEIINKNLKNKPVDIFAICCHGEAILSDKDILAAGSTIATIAQKNETASFFDVDKFNKALKNYEGDYSSKELLNLYLCKGLRNRITPVLGVSGQDGNWNLENLLNKKYIQNDINPEKVAESLKRFMSEEEIKEIISKINSKEVYAIDYGKALAVCLANDFARNEFELSINKISFEQPQQQLKYKIEFNHGFLNKEELQYIAINRNNERYLYEVDRGILRIITINPEYSSRLMNEKEKDFFKQVLETELTIEQKQKYQEYIDKIDAVFEKQQKNLDIINPGSQSEKINRGLINRNEVLKQTESFLKDVLKKRNFDNNKLIWENQKPGNGKQW